MIFVTVGTQAPFDRLIEAIDSIAPSINEKIIAQTLKGKYIPRHIEVVDFVSPDVFAEYFNNASVVVSHAGMGTIISALTSCKPLIIFPRKAALEEHRNEHQAATARRLGELQLVNVATDASSLAAFLHNRDRLIIPDRIGLQASPALIDSIAAFITT
ncbi:MAG: glycosyl transferase family 28 [Muribaculaceae bacterium]|nr:glycosyl transferase family 28 [Muribaculaceae bacterium]